MFNLLHLQQAKQQEVDITFATKCEGWFHGGGVLTAEDTVLDQYICPPVLELCAAG